MYWGRGKRASCTDQGEMNKTTRKGELDILQQMDVPEAGMHLAQGMHFPSVSDENAEHPSSSQMQRCE